MSDAEFARELAWVKRQMPLTARAVAGLPKLAGVRLACSMHLDIKMVPLVAGLLERGAALFLATCNPATVRDEVVAHLRELGADGTPWRGMPAEEWQRSFAEAIAWGPTHLCEMGADLSAAVAQREDRGPGTENRGTGTENREPRTEDRELRTENREPKTGDGEPVAERNIRLQPAAPNPQSPTIRASLEATGSGIMRLSGLRLGYPVFNWDDLPVKEGLHNRHMVGLTTWHTFFARTRLTLHGRRVLVVGYGLVGRGLADAARAFGGVVMVAERDPARALEAAYAGWQVLPLAEALPLADVVVTATGALGVVGAPLLPLLRDGAFLLNVGHQADEIDVAALLVHPHEEAIPAVTAVHLDGRRVYLFAGGAMANLAAGEGDSLNAFDVTLAVMTAGIGHIVGAGQEAAPGVHLLPREVWERWIKA